MNETVSKLVEIAFRDTQRTEEVQILYEQVLLDCQERFAEMTKNGIDEDEAIAAVVESLRGIEEVLREFPKKTEDSSGESGPEERFSEEERLDVSADHLKKLHVAVFDRAVHILPSSDGQLHLHTQSRDVRFHVSEGTVFAEEKQKETASGFARLISRIMTAASPAEPLYAEVPADCILDYELQTANGDIDWQGIQGASVSMVTASGNIWIRDRECQVETLYIRSSSGDIALSAGIRAGKLTVYTASGDIRGGASSDELDVHTISGELELDGNGTEIRMNTLSGDIRLAGRYSRAEVKSMSGDIEMRLESDELKVTSTSGDLSVRGRNRMIEARCTSGDLSVSGILCSFHGSTVSGDMEMDVRESGELKQLSADSRSGDITIRLPGDRTYSLEMRSVSGDVTSSVMEAEKENASAEIIAKTVSGDISVRS